MTLSIEGVQAEVEQIEKVIESLEREDYEVQLTDLSEDLRYWKDQLVEKKRLLEELCSHFNDKMYD